MKAILFSQVIFFSITLFGQPWQNQIPNYSFENITSSFPSPSTSGNNIPNCGFDGSGNLGTSGESYEYIQEYWGNVIEWTHPLVRTPCLDCPKVATADLRTTSFNPPPLSPRSGNNWGYTHGSGGGEYLIVPTLNFFNNGLNPSRTYYIEVFHQGSASNDLDVVGYENQPKICGYQNKLLQDINANSGHSNVLFSFNASNSSDWTRYRGYFSPHGFKKWLSFGNSGSWDDLRIYEVQNNKCRDNWYFDNTVFNYPLEVFQASNNIYVGNGVDPENGINHIPGDVFQYANSEVILRAGNQVIIDQGSFAQESGAKLLVIENTPCGDDLCPDELEFENEILCNEPSKVIGTEGNDWGTSVQWSPSTYLDNPNVANPTFTSPGGVGSITYEVQVTYTCDVSELKPNLDGPFPFPFSNSYTETHEVVVQYTNITDPTSSISANVIQDDAYNFEADLNFSQGVTEITIEVNSSPGYSETFYLGNDFSCCNFNWVLPNAWKWSSCNDDIIKVTAKNKCSGDETKIELPWNKSDVPFSMPSSYPNIITANNDGSNDQLCFDIESADYIEIVILNVWGNVMFEYFGPITESLFCTNAPFDNFTEGVYYYVITVSDVCGNEGSNHQFFWIVDSNKSSTNQNTDSERLGFREFLEQDVVLSPNPTSSILNIQTPSKISSITIIDKKGTIVLHESIINNQINVESLEPGTYHCQVSLNGMTVTKAFVKL
ncbi:MAG: gliding motility-associated C-terminal domain-containing protein [Brumimicrobium sp.]|nr:gliding motility-associated C-terminal domain-containing protein [Brumimicrobium sp.]